MEGGGGDKWNFYLLLKRWTRTYENATMKNKGEAKIKKD
jgi:hypothetical protein